ncbi:hypothetical protein [Mycobacteroides abscessus]|uniref:hypothetical protein n=1 Tax=Mycobacteroides abscessus TaxID=36809 RepID=UPI0005171D88|nr:hypothetical protein [Mycobacteroides abscessus]ORA29086.1 hypothetical protein BST18_08890 [Mycobacteroides abscessus subsp. bolletii]RIR88075.1 hypothetical protein D2E66_11390 [Mycobacteroides abscessus]TPF70288.1 hypothetical protein XW60_00690 [Mycobacteroides abscessus subsp. bolletii]BBB42322.1 hypothetical protein MASB_28880 [Mycobacteroides abscessus subsp. bolletii BD]
MDQGLWEVVSRMLAVLTVGYTAMLFVSKLISAFGGKELEEVGKHIECVALLALVFASIRILHPFVRPDTASQDSGLAKLVQLSPTDSVASSIRTYFYCSLWATVAVVGAHMSIRFYKRAWVRHPDDPAQGLLLVSFFLGIALLPIVGYVETLLEIMLPKYRWSSTGPVDGIIMVGAIVAVFVIGQLARRQNRANDPAKDDTRTNR